MRVSRRKLGLIASVSAGTEARISREQQMLDQHQLFLLWYEGFQKRKKASTTVEIRAEVEITPSVSVPKWCPVRHHFAVVFGEKILIHNEEEYRRYLSLGFKILPQ